MVSTVKLQSVPLNQLEHVENVLSAPSTDQPRAGLPVSDPTVPFWNTPGSNPLAREGSTGDLTSSADICIIGSGITGTSAAYHLAKNYAGKTPVSIVILEARDFCSGATGRNGGHLTPSAGDNFRAIQAAYGKEEALHGFRLEQKTADSMLNIIHDHGLESAVDLVHGGHISIFVTAAEYEGAKADLAAAKAAGLDHTHVEWLSKETMQSTHGTPFPGVRFGGHNLWPLKYVAQLYNLASKANDSVSLTLHTHTSATSVSKISADTDTIHRWEVTTPRGPIRSRYLIHATNGYASHLLPEMHGPGGIVPTRGQIIATRANAPLTGIGKSAWDGNEGFEYWFPRPLKPSEDPETTKPLFILGGGREATGPGFEFYITDDSVVNPKAASALRNFLPEVFPGKFEKEKEPEMEWTGIMGYTTMRDPFVGRIGDEGQYIAAGYTGHGMPRAFSCAQIVAGMILADISGGTYKLPDEFPKRYLVENRDPKTGLPKKREDGSSCEVQ